MRKKKVRRACEAAWARNVGARSSRRVAVATATAEELLRATPTPKKRWILFGRSGAAYCSGELMSSKGPLVILEGSMEPHWPWGFCSRWFFSRLLSASPRQHKMEAGFRNGSGWSARVHWKKKNAFCYLKAICFYFIIIIIIMIITLFYSFRVSSRGGLASNVFFFLVNKSNKWGRNLGSGFSSLTLVFFLLGGFSKNSNL